MTCIVGLEHGGKVYLASDSIATDLYVCGTRREPKVFKREEFVFGYTTSFRMGNLIQYKLKLPKPPRKNGNLNKFLCTKFIDSLRSCFESNGFMGVSDSDSIGKGRDEGGIFLVGLRGKLYIVDEQFCVGSSIDGFDAVGSGREHALAAMHALDGYVTHPKDRLTIALETAQKYGTTVRGPWDFVNT